MPSGIVIAITVVVIFKNRHRQRVGGGFTLMEAVVSITILGIGIVSTLGALTRINTLSSVSRNATGAQTVAQNQIDLLLSDSPFNPQKTNLDGSVQIPPELTLGTHTTNNVPIYKEPTTGVIVSGTMTTTVTDITGSYSGNTIPMYACTVAVTYTYRSKSYTTTMNTIRVSDL